MNYSKSLKKPPANIFLGILDVLKKEEVEEKRNEFVFFSLNLSER